MYWWGGARSSGIAPYLYAQNSEGVEVHGRHAGSHHCGELVQQGALILPQISEDLQREAWCKEIGATCVSVSVPRSNAQHTPPAINVDTRIMDS
jgi:hypothetical protein